MRPSPKFNRFARAIPILAASLALAGCDSLTGPASSVPQEEITELPRALTSAEVAAIAASNAFGLDLLGEAASADPMPSVFLSPLSASMALGMILNGADGGTFDGMRSALRFDGLAEEEINASYAGLLELLTGLDPTVETAVGNAVWYRQGLELDEGFGDRVRSSFDAAVEPVDFGDPATVGAINDWAFEATNGRIVDPVDSPLDANLAFIVMNAVYFQGSWTLEFDPADTREAPFHRLDGSTAPIELMSQQETFPYYGDHRFDAVELPYGGKAFAMTIVVPRQDDGYSIRDLMDELDAEMWTSILDNLSPRLVDVGLPRFELEWDAVLNDHLAAMGMEDAFQPGADFSRIFTNSAPWLDEVKQGTFIRVDEEGTEAAAVTIGAGPESTPATIADRPFLLAIRERLSGVVLFMGVIVEPPTL